MIAFDKWGCGYSAVFHSALILKSQKKTAAQKNRSTDRLTPFARSAIQRVPKAFALGLGWEVPPEVGGLLKPVEQTPRGKT